MQRRVSTVFGLLLASCIHAGGGGPAEPGESLDAGVSPLAPNDDAGNGGGDAMPVLDDPADVPDELVRAALPATFVPPPADRTNRYADDEAAAAFGRRLFFDTRFAGRLLDGDNDGTPQGLGRKGDTGKVACASCHVPAGAFSDTRSLQKQISLGAGWGRRRAPSLLDVAHSRVLMWDGRRDTTFNQAFGALENAVEMNTSRLFVAQQAYRLHRTEYEAIFGPMPPLDDAARFPSLSPELNGCSQLEPASRACVGDYHGIPGDGAEYDSMTPSDQEAVTRVVVNLGKALGAYQRQLECGESRFDRWARGEDPGALTALERAGARLFAGKGKCIGCHSGRYFSDEKFHNVGLKPELVATVFINANDRGAAQGLAEALADPLNSRGIFSDGDDERLPVSVGSEMEGAFRTPKLRCISRRPSFMHTAHLRTLDDVVAFFSRGGDRVGYLGANEIVPLDLTLDERAALVAFLLALEGPGPRDELLNP